MSEGEQTQIMTRKDLEAKIIAKAWSDDDFCRKFLEDPKGQFEEHLSTKLPESLIMEAYQEDSNHLYFVIPAKPQMDLDELSDEDLEKIAGGIDPFLIGISVVTIASMVGMVTPFVTAAVTIVVTAPVTATIAVGAGWGKPSGK